MSLLLKALEKSDEEGNQPQEGATEQAATAASVAPTTSGMKLGEAKVPEKSKLGSALAAGSQKAAQDVVSAFDEQEGTGTSEEDEDAAIAREIQKAQRMATLRYFAMLGVLVAVVVGGWYGYQNYFAEKVEQAVETAVQAATQAVTGEVEEEEVVFLPLAEPIYDIQENILAATTAPIASADTDSENGEVEINNVTAQVESYVERILQEQLRKARQIEEAANRNQEVVDTTGIEDELGDLLNQEVNWDEIVAMNSSGDMLAKLESLSNKPWRRGKQYVISAEVAAAEATATQEAPATEEGQVAQATVEPQSSADTSLTGTLARKENNFDELMKEGVLLYRAGDLDGAELAFRNILAVEPKNSQALVGLAKIHTSRGNNRVAAATLLKAAEYSPNDPLVVSELVALQSSQTTSQISRNRIYDLLARTNDKQIQAKLMFILGIDSAKNQDWLEAKTNFLAAYGLNSTNPDVAYNLAVVHDYLGEGDSAADMYRRALHSAITAPSSFNHKVARERAAVLERQ